MKKVLVFVLAGLSVFCLAGCTIHTNVVDNTEVKDQDAYQSGSTAISDKVTALDIDWASGQVEVVTSGDQTVSLKEECDKDLSEDKQMHWYLDGTTLRVTATKPGTTVSELPSKKLVLSIPETVDLAKCSFDVAATDLTVNLNKVGQLDVDAASGKANMTVADLTGSASVDMAAGDVTLSAGGKPSQISVDTALGDVTLCLDEACGFTAEVDSVSGSFKSDLTTTENDGTYVHGDGACRIKVDTASGDVNVRAR